MSSVSPSIIDLLWIIVFWLLNFSARRVLLFGTLILVADPSRICESSVKWAAWFFFECYFFSKSKKELTFLETG